MLSIALAVYNEEKNLTKCLDAVKDWAGEIVIVDGGSTDKTVEIAKRYTDKIIITDNPPIFHLNKQKVLDACSGDWILQLDADELVTPELKNEIQNIIIESQRPTTNDQRLINGYNIPRKNYFLGHLMTKGGLYPDYVIRLVKKGKAYFPCKSIHEQIDIVGETGYLKNDLLHFTNATLTDYWKNSIDRNSSLAANEIAKEKNNQIIIAANYLFILPVKWFYLRFLRHKGFMHGIYGLVFALGSALQYPIAYLIYLKTIKPVTRNS